MLHLLLAAAFAASPYADKSGDITAERVVSSTPEALIARLDTIQELASLLPEACVHDWEHGTEARGPSRVTYEMKAFKRRLTARISVVEPKRVELDHEGAKGFVTRFLLEPQDAGTKVTMTTYLNAPGWPLRKYYFTAVQPDWTSCQLETLERLAAP